MTLKIENTVNFQAIHNIDDWNKWSTLFTSFYSQSILPSYFTLGSINYGPKKAVTSSLSYSSIICSYKIKKKEIDYYPWHKRKLPSSVKTSGEHWLSHAELWDRIFSLPTSADISWNTDYFPPTLERDSYFKGQGIEGRKKPVLAKTTVNPLYTNALDKVLANVVPNSSSSPFRFWYLTLSRNLFESTGKVICNNTSRISQHASSLATCQRFQSGNSMGSHYIPMPLITLNTWYILIDKYISI